MSVDSFIQLTTDGSGKKLDTAIFNMGAGSTELHREKLIIADPVSTGGFATVTSSAGLSTVVTSGLVSITSGTVTLSSASSLSSGTVTLSSQITVTAVSASSGLVQISGTPTVVSASSGIIQLSSAPLVVVASSGGTQLVQSTAATNPWSSAPGFNMPVVSVSSGLVQVSGTITSASSGIIQLSSAPLVIVASSGGTQLVQSTAGTNPWSSAPGFNMPVVNASSGLVQVLTSGTLVVVNTSSGLVQVLASTGSGVGFPVLFSTQIAAGTTMRFKVTSSTNTPWTLSSAGPSLLFSIWGASTGLGPVFLQLYDATSSSVTVGTSIKGVIPLVVSTGAAGTTIAYAAPLFASVRGVLFTSGIAGAVTVAATGTVLSSSAATLTYEVLGT